MRDNYIQSNVASKIAADNINEVRYPRHKLIIGDDNENDGDVSHNNPLPVTYSVLPDTIGNDLAAIRNALGSFAIKVGIASIFSDSVFLDGKTRNTLDNGGISESVCLASIWSFYINSTYDEDIRLSLWTPGLAPYVYILPANSEYLITPITFKELQSPVPVWKISIGLDVNEPTEGTINIDGYYRGIYGSSSLTTIINPNQNYEQLVGNNVDTIFDINHGFDNEFADVSVIRVFDNSEIYAEIDRISANIVRIIFNNPPSTDQYKVIVRN